MVRDARRHGPPPREARLLTAGTVGGLVLIVAGIAHLTRSAPNQRPAGISAISIAGWDGPVEATIAATAEHLRPGDIKFARVVKLIAYHESFAWRFLTRAHPPNGEDVGAMGLRLRYFRDQGFTDLEITENPEVNIGLGAGWLSSLLTRASGDMETAIAAYAGGWSNRDQTRARGYAQARLAELATMF